MNKYTDHNEGLTITPPLKIDLTAIACLSVIVVAAALRFWDLGLRSIGYDESLHIYYAFQLSEGLGYQHNPITHGPFQFHIIGLFFLFFGDTEYISRVLAAMFGTILVGMPYFLKDRMGTSGAVITSILFTFSPVMLFYSRYARNDIIMAVWTLGIVIALWRYIDEGRSRYLYLAAFFLSLAFTTKETIFIVIAILGSYLLIITSIDWIPWILRKTVEDNLSKRDQTQSNDIEHLKPPSYGYYYSSPPIKKKLKDFSRAGAFMVLLFTLTFPQISAGVSFVQLGTVPVPILSNIFEWFKEILYDSGVILASTRPPEGFPSGQNLFELQGFQITKGSVIAVMIVIGTLWFSALAGSTWNKVIWLKCAGIFYLTWTLLYTSFLTNMSGIGTGVWQSLGYWLVQHDVNRGDQPWYYYLVITPIYELLPFTLTIVAIIYYIIKGNKFTRFLVYWCVLTFVFYSIAGEKMPWLIVNIALPMIVISGKFIGDIFTSINWKDVFSKNGILLLPITVLLIYLLVRLVFYRPEEHTIVDVVHLFTTTSFFFVALGLFLSIFVKLGSATGIRMVVLCLSVLLLLFGLKSAIGGSFEFQDSPNEMIVYAQTSQDVDNVMESLEEFYYRTKGGQNAKIIVDRDVYWGLAWYLRNFENVEYADLENINTPLSGSVLIVSETNSNRLFGYLDNYDNGQEFIYLWWPAEGYKWCQDDQFESCLSVDKLFDNFLSLEKWEQLFDYLIYRRTSAEFLYHNAIIYFQDK